MSEQQVPGVPEAAFEASGVVPAGALLRAARESHGLTIDVVAQHLKLAPRQVLAIEEGDYAALPGRTFVRGFARNYARLMQLDPEAILAALPEAVAAPALDKPSIGASSRAMGELPSSQQRNGATWSRWAIPLAIVALIGVAAVYEFTRKDAVRVADKASVPARKQVDEIGPLTAGGSPLPNPLMGTEPGATSPAAPEPAASAPAAGDQAAVPAPVTTPSLPISVPPAPATPSSAPGDATLVIKYSGASWTEVRDASGQRLLLAPGGPGRSETVTGTPPFEVTLGNAANASVTWRGAAFDLAPHSKGNVARARLP